MTPARTHNFAQPKRPRAAACIRCPWDLGCKSLSLANKPEDPKSITQTLSKMIRQVVFPFWQSQWPGDICLHLIPKASAMLWLCFLLANKQTTKKKKHICFAGNFLTVMSCPSCFRWWLNSLSPSFQCSVFWVCICLLLFCSQIKL